ncbi:MAG: ATP-binding protein [Angustibacter sp.]
MSPGRHHQHRIGLRASVTLWFATGALLASTVLALGTYLVARGSLVNQRERSATVQAFAAASTVRDGLRTTGVPVSEVLAAASAPAGSTILVNRGGRWFSSSLQVGAEEVPGALQDSVSDGSAGVLWTRVRGSPAVVVGVPLTDVDAEYFEIATTPELAGTLSTLRAVLLGFAVLTFVGGGVLGRAAARRVVAPLDDVGDAVTKIAGGDLSTRLPDTDDPELAKIVESFNAMVETLDERIRRDTRFAADLSHELRSPLTTLMTSVEVLRRRREELPERSRQALDLVHTELERLRQSLENMLELGRLDAGVGAASRSEIEVAELVREAVDTAHHRLELISVHPAADPQAGGSARVRVEKQQVRRALWNLLDNAVRHAGGPVAIRVEPAGGSILVAVDDAGPGVDDQDRERIFERFYRAGSRGSRQGTGLGLSLVAETAHAHGGSVWCTNKPGGGARFVLRLPVAGRRPR